MELKVILEATIEGSVSRVEELTGKALAEGIAPAEILSKALIPAMDEVGRLFERQEYFLPELIAAANAMQSGLKMLRPLLGQGDQKAAGRVVVGTVEGDLHSMGKNLVMTMLEGAGFEVVDLGVDISPAEFVAAVRQHQPQVVGMSSLLTTTMAALRTTIDALKEAGLRGQIKVVVGGAPVSQKYADLIGADGYAPDAGSAVRKVRELLEQ